MRGACSCRGRRWHGHRRGWSRCRRGRRDLDHAVTRTSREDNMIDTTDFAMVLHEQRQQRERAQIESMRKQKLELPYDARKAVIVEQIQKPEPLA